MALAVSVLLVIGQIALVDHVMSDLVQGVDDNCVLCHQSERQQSTVPGIYQPVRIDLPHLPSIAADSTDSGWSRPARPNNRAPPLA